MRVSQVRIKAVGAVVAVMLMLLPSMVLPICGSPPIDPDTVIVPPEFQQGVERGDTEALYAVGMLYEGSAPATELLMRAARQGHPGAQNMIGLSHAHGCRVEQDDVLAYMWFSLAVRKGLAGAEGNLNFVAGRMTEEQVSRARQMVEEWRPVEKAE